MLNSVATNSHHWSHKLIFIIVLLNISFRFVDIENFLGINFNPFELYTETNARTSRITTHILHGGEKGGRVGRILTSGSWNNWIKILGNYDVKPVVSF